MGRPYSPPQVSSRSVTRTREKCLVDGCDRLEELASGRSAGGLCAGHRKRKQQQAKGLLTVPFESPIRRRRSPRAALIDAAMSLGDVDTDADFDTAFRRAVDRLTHAAMRYREARKLSERRKAPSK